MDTIVDMYEGFNRSYQTYNRQMENYMSNFSVFRDKGTQYIKSVLDMQMAYLKGAGEMVRQSIENIQKGKVSGNTYPEFNDIIIQSMDLINTNINTFNNLNRELFKKV